MIKFFESKKQKAFDLESDVLNSITKISSISFSDEEEMEEKPAPKPKKRIQTKPAKSKILGKEFKYQIIVNFILILE